MKTLTLFLFMIFIVVGMLSNTFAMQNKREESGKKYTWQGIEYHESTHSDIVRHKSAVVRILFADIYINEINEIYYEITDGDKIKQVLKNLKEAKREKYECGGTPIMFQYKDGTGAYLVTDIDRENEFVYGYDFKSKALYKTFVECGLLKQSLEAKLNLNEKEKLAFSTMKLMRKARKSDKQAIWFARRLEKCLSELEKTIGFEEMPFNWENARGIIELQGAYRETPTKKTVPFYVPCPNIPDMSSEEDILKFVRIYSDNPEFFRRDIEAAAGKPGGEWEHGREIYIAYLEKRLKRLQEYLSTNSNEAKMQQKTQKKVIESNQPSQKHSE